MYRMGNIFSNSKWYKGFCVLRSFMKRHKKTSTLDINSITCRLFLPNLRFSIGYFISSCCGFIPLYGVCVCLVFIFANDIHTTDTLVWFSDSAYPNIRYGGVRFTELFLWDITLWAMGLCHTLFYKWECQISWNYVISC